MSAPWRSKWFDWRPKGKVIANTAECEPTELTKPNSVGSVSSNPGETPIILPIKTVQSQSTLTENLAHPEEVAEAEGDQYGLGLWPVARCVTDSRFSLAIDPMYLDFCIWRLEVGIPVATKASFAQDIREAGYPIENGFVRGLVLKGDWISPEQLRDPEEAPQGISAFSTAQ